MFYQTGLRKSELQNLLLWDVDLDEKMIFVTGKFSKKRVVPLGDSMSKLLTKYINKVRPRLIKYYPGQDRVFTAITGQQLGDDDLSHRVRKYTGLAKIEKHITLHSFRHTCATHLLQNGANVRHIQQLLGHEKISTTEIYTRVNLEDLRKVYDQCHPRALNDVLY